MRCVIVNKNYPPGSGITGYSAFKLAQYLSTRGVQICVVTTDSDYGGVRSDRCEGAVVRCKSIYNGKDKYLRFLSSLLEGKSLAAAAIKTMPSVVISMADPALLNFWIGKRASAASVAWFYWSMDLYPDAFCAAGLLSKPARIYQWIAKAIKRREPSLLIALGPNQLGYIQREYGWSTPSVILPCGVSECDTSVAKPRWAEGNFKTLYAYAGNLGEAHSLDFLLEIATNLDFSRDRLVLSVYGSKSAALLAAVKNIEGVLIVPTISQSELRFIDVHLVSLLSAWDHVCVPSKAVTAICQGGSMLFFGSAENDTWQLLGECGWRVDPQQDLARQVRGFVSSLSADEIAEKKRHAQIKAKELREMEQKAFEKIYEQITRVKAS